MTTQAVPPRTLKPDQVEHPGWCSPDHCRADRVGRTHESAPVEVAGVTVSVSQTLTPPDREPTHAVVLIEPDPDDGESRVVVLRLGEVPEFTRALLAFYCQQA